MYQKTKDNYFTFLCQSLGRWFSVLNTRCGVSLYLLHLIKFRPYLLWFSFRPLFREYGELLVRCGLIGEAITVYEDLELWDNLIYCYWYVNIREEYKYNSALFLFTHLASSWTLWSHLIFDLDNSLLEKKATAVELIKKRLSEKPNDPRLWYVMIPYLNWIALIDSTLWLFLWDVQS